MGYLPYCTNSRFYKYNQVMGKVLKNVPKKPLLTKSVLLRNSAKVLMTGQFFIVVHRASKFHKMLESVAS